MKIRYDINTLIVNAYFDDKIFDYSNNQEYQQMLKDGNFIETTLEQKFPEAILVKKGKSFIYKEYIYQPTDQENINNLKNQLISSRQTYLSSTDYKVLKLLESGLSIDNNLKLKRQQARDEINLIKSSLSLNDLQKYNINFN